MTMHDKRRSLIYRSERFGIPEFNGSKHLEVKRLYEALSGVWAQWNSLLDGVEAIAADTTLPADLQKIRIKRHAENRLNAQAIALSGIIAEAHAEISRQTKAFETALMSRRSAADETRKGQIRNALLSMPDGKRTETIRNAIQSGDLAIIEAVASGYAWESGAIAMHMDECKTAFCKLTSKDEFEKVTQLREGVEHLQKALYGLADAVTQDVIPPDAALIQHKQEAAKQAEGGNENAVIK